MRNGSRGGRCDRCDRGNPVPHPCGEPGVARRLSRREGTGACGDPLHPRVRLGWDTVPLGGPGDRRAAVGGRPWNAVAVRRLSWTARVPHRAPGARGGPCTPRIPRGGCPDRRADDRDHGEACTCRSWPALRRAPHGHLPARLVLQARGHAPYCSIQATDASARAAGRSRGAACGGERTP